MNKYAVAVTEFFDNEIKVVIVMAENEKLAMLNAVEKFLHPGPLKLEDGDSLIGDTDWLNSLKDYTIEDIQQEIYDADMNVSEAVKI